LCHELRKQRGTRKVYDSSAAFRFEVPKRACRRGCRNFKSAALDFLPSVAREGGVMTPNIFMGFDFGLGADADMLRDSARRFASEQIAPRADEIDRSNEFPRDLWPKMGRLGLLGITVEDEWGGAGLGYLEHCVAMEEI